MHLLIGGLWQRHQFMALVKFSEVSLRKLWAALTLGLSARSWAYMPFPQGRDPRMGG